ncbi:DUF3383 family protein [Pluralibacter gergoviae]|uniref:DUF3383 family protein n=1 Tax=Pluralibacter gergoviae TaxID=61647 RepID=A0AAI9GK03_PLUGE|nr:DUF3383 family protein [Pluralibacter gergoviae]EKV9907715.1 DUF3383 family protein [Pluralibacter gergoviae]EKW7276816.1 DUF3383 family protein [Pluralibacter gergoviae]ELD4293953.1 DUF3383 family protein [Pluralibacter gergoviae]ELD4304732.1 DUF3383 family protein [Pluralibacter gergoviae]
MSYSVDNIIPVNVILRPSGLGYANFSSAFAFADAADLANGVTFDVDTFRDYSSLSELAGDFKTDSDIYLIASRWFAQIPKPPQISVWMCKPAESVLDTVVKADDRTWRYHYFFKHSAVNAESLASLGDWGDAQAHPIWHTSNDVDITDANKRDDLASLLQKKGSRHMFLGYTSKPTTDKDPSQLYAMVQLAAAFHKFRPLGTLTAITGEYQVLPGVTGDDLTTSAYNALKAKNTVFFTQIELAGETDSCRVINSKTMSNYGEFIDDVINLDVLKNYIQVDGYNYIANPGTKRALTPKDYAGLLATIASTCKRFYDNGVLGAGSYVDRDDGVTKTADFGYVIRSKPEDVLNLTTDQRKKREYPPVSLLVILARAGHVAEINVTVE